MDIDAADLFPERVGVDLAHVAAAIGFFELSDPQLPFSEIVVMVDGDAVVAGNDALVEAEDRLVGQSHPSDLNGSR